VLGEVLRKIWKCNRCGHEWLSRDHDKPLRCAKCKTAYWDQSKKSEKNHGGKK
jgi:ribosomal protein S27AE